MKILNVVRSTAIVLIALSSCFATADVYEEYIGDEIYSVTTGGTHEAPLDHKAVFVPVETSDILVAPSSVTLITPDSEYYDYEAPDGYKTKFVPVGTPSFMVQVIGFTLIETDSGYYEAPDGFKVVFVPVKAPNALVKAAYVSLITPDVSTVVDQGPWYDYYDLNKDGVIDGKSAEGCVYDPYVWATLEACYGR